MKTIDTLIEDIYALLDNGKEEPTQEYIDHLAKDIATNIATSVIDYAKPREGKLRMSNVGRPCNRQLWYEGNGEAGEPIDAPTKIKFMYGHVIEAILLYLAKEAGHTVTHEQEEIEIQGIKGHMDAVIDGVVIDVKSASKWAFDNKFKAGDLGDDSFGYIPQISGYAKALNCNEAAFLAMNKVSGELALMKVPELADIDAIIQHTKHEVDGEVLPPRGFNDQPDGKSGNRALHQVCSYCAFKKSCYPNLRAYQYYNGIKYLTKVVNPPKVPEVKA